MTDPLGLPYGDRAAYASHTPSYHPAGTTCPNCKPRATTDRLLSTQGAGVVVGGGLLCSECTTQQPATGMLDGSGRCSRCAP